jgi:hypothetical protein
MQGGGEADNIARWKELALAEPDSRHRSDYGAFALVFAELVPWRAAWREASKGWNMRESQQVLEWQAEARLEGRAEGLRSALEQTLEQRFQAPVSAEVKTALNALSNPDELSRWLREALQASSLDAFQAAFLHGRNGA